MLRTPRHTLFDYEPVEQKPQKLQPNGFAHLARFAFRNAVFILLLWCVVAAIAIFFVSQKIQRSNQQPFEFSSASTPAETLKLLNKNLPNLESLIAISLSNENPEALSSVRDALVSLLENQKDQFEFVFSPGTGDYYESHALLYHSKQDIAARVAYALSLRPLFSALAQAPNTESISTLVSEVSAAIKQGRDPQGLDDLFRQSASSLQALMQNSKQPVDWTVIAGLNIDPAAKSALILVLPKLNQDEKAVIYLKQTLVALGEKTATQAKLEQASTVRNEARTAAYASGPITLAMSLAFFSALLVLYSVLGGANLVAMISLPTTIGVIISVLIASINMPANVLSLWPVFAGVGFFGLLISTRFVFSGAEAMSENRNLETAIMLAAQKQGIGLLWLTIINLAVWAGFFALWGHQAAFTAAIAATGIVSAFCASLTLVPAIARLFGPQFDWPAQGWITPTYEFLFGNRIWVSIRMFLTLIVLAATGAAVFYAPDAFKNMKMQGSENQPVNLIVASSEEAQSLLERLKSVPEASAVRWLGAFLPQDVDEKLAALAPLKDQFPRIGSLNAQTSDDMRDQIATLQDTLREIAALPSTRPELRSAADEFRHSVELLLGTSTNAEIVEIENRLFGRFNNLADRANSLASLEKPNLETLDPHLKLLFQSPDDIYRIEVSPMPGKTNAQLAEIFFKNNFPVAHPSLVEGQRAQDLKSSMIYAATAATVLGLVLMCMSIAEGAGIASSILTSLLLISLFAGVAGLTKLDLQAEYIFGFVALLALLFSISASIYLKAQISVQGAQSALYAVEAWLPAIVTLACIAPVFLLGIDTAKTSAIIFSTAIAAMTAIIGFLLRPLTLFFRKFS